MSGNESTPNLNHKQPYGTAARLYLDADWGGPLWLPTREKESPPTGFTGHGAPYPTLDEIRKWIAEHGDGNIALRLGAVANGAAIGRPVVYAGNNVTGWEFIGIDVDDYDDKHGGEQLKALEQGLNGLPALGALPATAVSSSRWNLTDAASGLGSFVTSGIRVYMVPAGYLYKGKAAEHIDVIYSGLRYMVVWPSVHPNGAGYVWRYGCDEEGWVEFTGGIPGMDDVATLPEKWFEFLCKGSDTGPDAKSDLDYGELTDWARAVFHAHEAPCRLVKTEIDNYIDSLDVSDSHHPMNNVVSRVINNAVEGHCGYAWALREYVNAWMEMTGGAGKRDYDTMFAEVGRSVQGALAKAKARWDANNEYIPDDTCESGTDPDCSATWEAAMEAKLADGDYGGLGPIVGKVELAPAKPAGDYAKNDRGNGRHFIDLFTDNAKYVDSRRSWVLWDGERWHRDYEDKLVGLAFSRVEARQAQYAASLRAGNPDKEALAKAKAWYGWSLKSGEAGRIKTSLTLAKGMYCDGVRVALSGKEFDANPKLLGCANGILELDDDPDVRAPEKTDYVTYNTHVPYVSWRSLANSEGKTFEGFELWHEYLELFMEDTQIRRFAQKVLGHLLIGGNPEKLIVFLYGDHDTGKSTMLGAIAGALGDYFGTIDIGLFKHKDLNPALIRAVPLRVTAMSEVAAGTMDGETIKMLTGNDRVTAEAKYSNEIFEGTPQFTNVIACNNPPNIKHADEALNERILVLPFLHPLTRSERKYERQKQIETHSGVAVLAWLVEGWKMYIAEGLKRDDWPNIVKRHNREFGSGLNATREFIHECLEKASECEDGRHAIERARRKCKSRGRTKVNVTDMDLAWTPTAGRVYELYVRWCQKNGVPATGHPELTKDIGLGKTQQRKVDGKNQRCYVGVRLKDVDTNEPKWRVK